METKVCESCGMEKPLDEFVKWKKKNGDYGYGPVCLKCVTKRAYDKQKQKKREGKLSVFTDEDILNEVKRRGLIV